jgi:CheY-like chemotaxis protein
MNTSASAALPRILLLEDDPVSAAFLAAALESVPAHVDVAHSLAEARVMTSAHTHDLWLFDANLPDGLGTGLLAELRARGLRTPALAHTADNRREALDALIDAGFEEVLLKPLSVAQLQGAVRRRCGNASISDVQYFSRNTATPSCGKRPVWDDDAALRAFNGHRAHVDTMRGLFAQELPQVSVRISAALAYRDDAALRNELHKLQASCGCGSARSARCAGRCERRCTVRRRASGHAGVAVRLNNNLRTISRCARQRRDQLP